MRLPPETSFSSHYKICYSWSFASNLLVAGAPSESPVSARVFQPVMPEWIRWQQQIISHRV